MANFSSGEVINQMTLINLLRNTYIFIPIMDRLACRDLLILILVSPPQKAG